MTRTCVVACSLVLLFTSAVHSQSKIPADPTIDTLVEKLLNKDRKLQETAAAGLKARIGEVTPYLRQLFYSVETDPKIRTAIKYFVDNVPSSPEHLDRALAFARKGKVDLALEQLLIINPSAYDPKYWQTVLDLGSELADRAAQFYKKDFEKPVLRPERLLEDYIEKLDVIRFQWIPSIGFGASSHHADFSGCVRANQLIVEGEMKGIALSSWNSKFNLINDSIILTHDAARLGGAVNRSLIILTDNNLSPKDKMRVYGSVIISRRAIPMISEIQDSVIVSSEAIGRDTMMQPKGKFIIAEKQAKPLDFIEWFETSQLGIEAGVKNDEHVVMTNGKTIVIAKLDEAKVFAKAGCKVGDVVVSIDDYITGSLDRFHRSLRRALVNGRAILALQRGKNTIYVSVTFKE
jgi:hypothetical protein